MVGRLSSVDEPQVEEYRTAYKRPLRWKIPIATLALAAAVLGGIWLGRPSGVPLLSGARRIPGSAAEGFPVWRDNQTVEVVVSGQLCRYDVLTGRVSGDAPTVYRLKAELDGMASVMTWLGWWSAVGSSDRPGPPRPIANIPSVARDLVWVADAPRCNRMVWEFEIDLSSCINQLLDRWLLRTKPASRRFDQVWVSRKDGAGMQLIGEAEQTFDASTTKPLSVNRSAWYLNMGMFSGSRRSGLDAGVLSPVLSPDGKWLAFSYDKSLWVKTLD